MKLSIILTLLFSLNTFAAGYYQVAPVRSESIHQMRVACPNNCETKETFYGASMMPSGFSMVYSADYIRVVSKCFGLSTNADKMMTRALETEDDKTLKRLKCYTQGLQRDLLKYNKNGMSAIEIARKYKNKTALQFLQAL